MFKNYGSYYFFEEGLIAEEIEPGIFNCYECMEELSSDGELFKLSNYFINANFDEYMGYKDKEIREEKMLDILYSSNTSKFANVVYLPADDIYEMFKDKVNEEEVNFDHFGPVRRW